MADEENQFNSDLLINEEKAIRKVRDAEKQGEKKGILAAKKMIEKQKNQSE